MIGRKGGCVMVINAGILIDFGNSETRVILLSGSRRFRFNLTNRFAELPVGYKVNNKYGNGKSTVFSIGNTYYANGKIVDQEFPGTVLRPSALESKTEQLVTDLTLNLAFIKALNLLSLVYKVDIKLLEVSFDVSVLLPPLDHEANEPKMIKKLHDLNSISVHVPNVFNKEFKIRNVNVQPEAVAAFFGAFFTERGVTPDPQNDERNLSNGDVLVFNYSNDVILDEVEQNLPYMRGYTICLDIGAGTTDIALFNDGELVENSKDTFKRGGNTIQSIVGLEIRKKYSFTPPSLENVVKTGSFEEGGELTDVTSIVTYAKDQYSKLIMEDIRQYLERMMVGVRNINGLLVAGGGGLATKGNNEENKSPAMSEFIEKYLKDLAPKIKSVHTEDKDLRSLNIDGLLYIHKYA